MPTTFDVISLGNFADIDTVEGNTTAENASALVGVTFGGPGNALSGNIQTLSPGSSGFGADGNTYYDMDDPTPETFSIDGGPDQGFDATSVYNATITYFDGSTATITAVIFQDTAGNTYWAPEFSANADQTAIDAGPVLSLTLDSLSGSTFSGMTGNRQDGFVPCFTPGAMIATTSGARPVEDLCPGDLVVTRDNGLEPLRWVGRVERPVESPLVPVRIAAGSLGPGMPSADLVVSPQHRMLVRSRIAARMFGTAEVLIPAKRLLGFPGVTEDHDRSEVTYIHLLFDGHQVIFANGAPTESLYLGPGTRAALSVEARSEIRALFPDMPADDVPAPARILPPGRMIRRLLDRHIRNAKPLLAGA